MTIRDIAQICHEANRAYCQATGDFSQKTWDTAPDWQKQSSVNGVEFLLKNPEATARDTHSSWLNDKVKAGWAYGPVKDEEKKTHPCMVMYDDLPLGQRTKDDLYLAIVRALGPHVHTLAV